MAPSRKTSDKAADSSEETSQPWIADIESLKKGHEETQHMLSLLLERTAIAQQPASSEGHNAVAGRGQGDGQGLVEGEANQEVFQQGPAGHPRHGQFPYPRPSQGLGGNGFGNPYSDSQTHWDSRIRKLELPIFTGERVNQWIFKAERYFRANGLVGEEALLAATLCLEDKAFSWFTWYDKMSPIISWGQLKEALIERFQGLDAMETYERFLSIKQIRSVMEYREEFEELAGSLEGLAPQAVMANFLRGLRREIRHAVKIQRPRDLQEAMYLAQLIEDQDRSIVGRTSQPNHRPYTAQPRHRSPTFGNDPRFSRTNMGASQPAGNHPKPAPPAPRPPFRTQPCYKCQEPWEPGHRCAPQALRMLEVPEEPEDEESEETPVAFNNVTTEPVTLENVTTEPVTLENVTTQESTDVMKVEGELRGTPVTILVDSGATHNFISPELVREKEIPVDEEKEFQVSLGTGVIQKSHGVCPLVHFHIDDMKIRAEFRRLPLGSANMVLGMQWLKTLGDTKFNWKNRTMEFMYGGRRVLLKGNPALRPTKALQDQVLPWQRKNHRDGYNEAPDGVGRTRLKDYGYEWPNEPPDDLEDKIGLWGAGPDTSPHVPRPPDYPLGVNLPKGRKASGLLIVEGEDLTSTIRRHPKPRTKCPEVTQLDIPHGCPCRVCGLEAALARTRLELRRLVTIKGFGDQQKARPKASHPFGSSVGILGSPAPAKVQPKTRTPSRDQKLAKFMHWPKRHEAKDIPPRPRPDSCTFPKHLFDGTLSFAPLRKHPFKAPTWSKVHCICPRTRSDQGTSNLLASIRPKGATIQRHPFMAPVRGTSSKAPAQSL